MSVAPLSSPLGFDEYVTLASDMWAIRNSEPSRFFPLHFKYFLSGVSALPPESHREEALNYIIDAVVPRGEQTCSVEALHRALKLLHHAQGLTVGSNFSIYDILTSWVCPLKILTLESLCTHSSI